jgi:hypothetical protein
LTETPARVIGGCGSLALVRSARARARRVRARRRVRRVLSLTAQRRRGRAAERRARRRARRGHAASRPVPEPVRREGQRRRRARAARGRRGRQAAAERRGACDGVAYVDDRNWTKRGPEIVLRDDDPRDVARVRDALTGTGGGESAEAGVATRKDDALRRELELVEHAGTDPVIVETERVATSPLTRALERRALAGEPTTMIVGRAKHHSRTEAHAITEMRHDGVDVRAGGTNEKLALAGDTAWIGSVNATGVSGRNAGQLEWGTLTRDPTIVGVVRTSLQRDVA